jgi:hypothetical protein
MVVHDDHKVHLILSLAVSKGVWVLSDRVKLEVYLFHESLCRDVGFIYKCLQSYVLFLQMILLS